MIWKSKAGRQLPVSVARELIENGHTAEAVSGFRGRSGRSFQARLALRKGSDGRWRTEFDEPWAKPAVNAVKGEAEDSERGRGAGPEGPARKLSVA